MAASVTITVDTTPPAGVAITLDAGAATTSDTTVSAAVTTTDGTTTGYRVKFWGDVVGAATEPAGWTALASPHEVVLTTGDGVKTVNVRMDDGLGNESAVATDTITLDTTLPVVTVNSGPTAGTISEVTGFDRSSFAWSVSAASLNNGTSFDEYKVKVVASAADPHTAGTLVPTTAGSTNAAGAAGGYAAATNITTEIDGTDLKTASAGDGPKILKVFVRDGAEWSA